MKVENLSKSYVLATDRTDSFRAYLYSLAKHLFRPDSRPKETEFCALDGVSFTVKRGDAIGILGSNGAGKSTLLKIISGITAPGSGQFALHGKVRSVLEVGTGFHPDLNARDNVLLNGALLGMKRSEILRQVDEIIAFSGIGDYAQQPVKHYSSGMYVRLAFSVAAFLKSDILLLDEVLSVGDAAFRRKAMNKIKDLLREGTAVLFVTHNLGEILDLCNQCIWMEHGRIRAMGNSVELVKDYLENSLWANPEVTGRDSSEAMATDSRTIGQQLAHPAFEAGSAAEAPGDRLIAITQVAARAKNKTIGEAIYMNEVLVLSLSIALKETAEQPVFVGFRINDLSGLCVFGSSSILEEGGAWVTEAGSYSWEIEVPANFFNAGIFSLNVAYNVGFAAVTIIPGEILYFRVLFNEEERDKPWFERFPGATRPLVNWRATGPTKSIL